MALKPRGNSDCTDCLHREHCDDSTVTHEGDTLIQNCGRWDNDPTYSTYTGRSIRPDQSRLKTLKERLAETTYYADPASAEYHCNRRGGLYEHSTNVLTVLRQLTENEGLVWHDPSSPEIIALSHDVCKIGGYLETKWGYIRNPSHPPGHGDRSVEIVRQWIDLTEEEELCIRWHMGAYDDKENWNRYNEALQRYPNVFWVHNADMIATHFIEIGGI